VKHDPEGVTALSAWIAGGPTKTTAGTLPGCFFAMNHLPVVSVETAARLGPLSPRDCCPKLDHRLIAGKPQACMSRNGVERVLAIGPMPTVKILPDGVTVQTKPGTSLLAAAAAGGVELMHSCGGIGACTSCRVHILSGQALSPIGRAEREQLRESGILETHRLACQTMVYGDVVLERPLWRTSPDSPVTGD